MVTVVALVKAVVGAVQPVNAAPSPTVGIVGILNPGAKTTTMVSGPLEPPPALKPIVHVVFVAPPSMEEPLNVTAATPVITTSAVGEPGPSADVATVNDVFGYDPAAAGLVMPAIVSVSGLPNVQTEPVRLIATVWPLLDPLVGDVVHDPRVTAGEAGITNPSGNVTEMVSASVSAVAGVNETVQVVVAPATFEGALNVTPDTGAADAGRASRAAPRPPATKPSAKAIGTILARRERRQTGPLRLKFLACSTAGHSARLSLPACCGH
jgi:hypothetical protein